MSDKPYNIDDAAMLIRKETAETLINNNLILKITQTVNPTNPRDLGVCTLLGVDVAIKGNNDFNSYRDFAEQFFSQTGQSIDNFYWAGVKRDNGRIVTVSGLEPWSVSQSIGIIYISESDVLDMFIETAKSIEVGQFGADLHMIAVERMENEVSLYSSYMQNNIHDITISTKDGSTSHTVKHVYALPTLTNNKAGEVYTGLNSLVNDAVIEGRDAVLSATGEI